MLRWLEFQDPIGTRILTFYTMSSPGYGLMVTTVVPIMVPRLLRCAQQTIDQAIIKGLFMAQKEGGNVGNGGAENSQSLVHTGSEIEMDTGFDQRPWRRLQGLEQ
ncbi:hypothetical protein DUI87_32225 [Hirundo rustica rustica]|uniref:Uncharacterized protein n=1 Tax=Hirundo rustica rustica TaxID=333673 RepID=A0A3M0IXG6_HIRRU|nr:hypothetical protein DUI87_32225 [Hirundo rustica rustica]